MTTLHLRAVCTRRTLAGYPRAALTLLTALFVSAGCSGDDAPRRTELEAGNAPAHATSDVDGASTPPLAAVNDAGTTPSLTPEAGAISPPSMDAGTTPGLASDAMPPSAPDAASPDASSAMADCTPVNWANPGMIANSKLTAIADDAGKGRPFEQRAGMDEFGYELHEFLITGTTPAYATRLTVRRPKDPAKYSGSVFVEWYNVSGGIDFAVLWANSREYFMREGHVFVAVSAQAAGANALKDTDAQRYGAINHPGDNQANAIFSQAGVALRMQSEALLGRCMPVRALLALGQSQSAGRLTDYVNNVHKSAKVYDGFMIHSGGEPASSDPGVPTFVIQTMSEGNGTRADGPTLVKWVVAGATHNDKRITTRGAEVATDTGQTVSECRNPLNEFPSYRVYNAALNWLARWARKGEKPPAGKPFESSGSTLALDADGNVRGGVRIADIDVPIASYGTDNGPVDPLDLIGFLACGLGGVTVPFTPAKLLERYPDHDAYVSKYKEASDKALASGYLLQADYDESLAQAKAAPIPK